MFQHLCGLYCRGDHWSPAFCHRNFGLAFVALLTERNGRPMVAPTGDKGFYGKRIGDGSNRMVDRWCLYRDRFLFLLSLFVWRGWVARVSRRFGVRRGMNMVGATIGRPYRVRACAGNQVAPGTTGADGSVKNKKEKRAMCPLLRWRVVLARAIRGWREVRGEDFFQKVLSPQS